MTTYHPVGGFRYAGMPLAEWLDLWADVAEHNRRVYGKAVKQWRDSTQQPSKRAPTVRAADGLILPAE